jgi:hypothetical protein
MRLVGFAPCLEPTFKRLGVDAGMPKPSGGSLADIAAVLAIDNYASTGKVVRPGRYGLGFHLPGCRQQVPARIVVITWTNVDKHRRGGQADDTG